jgi:hypothetical protein
MSRGRSQTGEDPASRRMHKVTVRSSAAHIFISPAGLLPCPPLLQGDRFFIVQVHWCV